MGRSNRLQTEAEPRKWLHRPGWCLSPCQAHILNFGVKKGNLGTNKSCDTGTDVRGKTCVKPQRLCFVRESGKQWGNKHTSVTGGLCCVPSIPVCIINTSLCWPLSSSALTAVAQKAPQGCQWGHYIRIYGFTRNKRSWLWSTSQYGWRALEPGHKQCEEEPHLSSVRESQPCGNNGIKNGVSGTQILALSPGSSLQAA